MARWSTIVLLLICCFMQANSYAQYKIEIHRYKDDSTPSPKFPLESLEPNEVINQLQKIVPELHQNGFLSASIDSVKLEKNTYNVWLYIGQKFNVGNITYDSTLTQIIKQEKFVLTKQEGIWQHKKWISEYKKILDWCQDNGYPFAQLQLTKSQIDSLGFIHGEYSLITGEKRNFDSIIIEGNFKIDEKTFFKLIKSKKGNVYCESCIEQMEQQLADLPYLTIVKPAEVIFRKFSTTLKFFVDEKKANQINGIIGLQPNTVETGKFLLTADALLAFKNAIGYGESFGITYQNLQYKSPRLVAQAAWPFLFGTDLSIDGKFDLYQNQLSFRKTGADIGLKYDLNQHSSLRLYYQWGSSKAINIDTASLLAQKSLPKNGDFKTQGIGLTLAYYNTNVLNNPKNGWHLTLDLNGRKRDILRNNTVLVIAEKLWDVQTQYDSAQNNPIQLISKVDINKYSTLSSQLVLKTSLMGAKIFSNNLFVNELMQIGGSQILRGFDEKSLWINNYAIAIAELRYYFAPKSFILAFSDNGYLKSDFHRTVNNGWYHGFGAGISIENKSSIMTVTYALGKSPIQGVQFNQSKIHIGYAAFF